MQVDVCKNVTTACDDLYPFNSTLFLVRRLILNNCKILDTNTYDVFIDRSTSWTLISLIRTKLWVFQNTEIRGVSGMNQLTDEIMESSILESFPLAAFRSEGWKKGRREGSATQLYPSHRCHSICQLFRYNIFNFQKLDNGSYKYIQVGEYDGNTAELEDTAYDEDFFDLLNFYGSVQFPGVSGTPIKSICSEACLPGHIQVRLQSHSNPFLFLASL